MTSSTRTADRVRQAEALLRAEGFPDGRVDAEGPDGEIAAIHLPDPLREQWLRFGETGLATRLRALGFRYVALDLAADTSD